MKSDGTLFLVLFLLGVLILIVLFEQLMITAAKKRKGVIYNIIESINAICMIYLIFSGLYIVLVGIKGLYELSEWLFYVFCLCAFYMGYYYYVKNIEYPMSKKPPKISSQDKGLDAIAQKKYGKNYSEINVFQSINVLTESIKIKRQEKKEIR